MITLLKYTPLGFLLFISAAMASEVISSSALGRLQIKGFTLIDQYKAEHKQEFPRERISIFALADRKGSDQLEDWIAPFYERYEENVDICGIANLKGVPKLLQPMIRRLFRKGVAYPVMMDWTGSVCESFGYQAGMADIFVVSRDGTLLHRINGETSKEKLETCYALIDGLMKADKPGQIDDSASSDLPPGPSRPLPEATSDEQTKES